MDPGQALEDELVDAVSVHRDRAGDPGAEGRLRFRQPADQVEDLPAQLALQGDEVGLGSHPREPLLPRRVELPRALDLVREIRRDARPLGLRLEHAEHLGGGHLRGQGHGRARDDHDEGEDDPDPGSSG